MFSLLFFLFGCNDEIASNEEISKYTSFVEDETLNTQDNVSSPSDIKLIDPNTKEIVETITPGPYKLELEFNQFTEEVRQTVKELANGSQAKAAFNKSMILDQFDPSTGKIIKGRPMITVKEEDLVDAILQQSFTGGDVVIPLKVTESGYKKEDVPFLNEVVLASYTTIFNSNRIGRSKNIELSAAAINYTIVGSGDFFSFNNTVGPRDVASGYQEAPEIIQGKIVMGIGGGICQTSSTLFNAVDKLGVEIIERHHHSKDVGYVPKGRDATVSFGGLDFVFQNTIGIPFVIRTYYGPGFITVQITTSKENEYILRNLED